MSESAAVQWRNQETTVKTVVSFYLNKIVMGIEVCINLRYIVGYIVNFEGMISLAYVIGNRIVLREYQWEDLPHIRQWVNDPEITDGLNDIFLFPHTLQETENFLRMMIEGNPGTKGFVIADKESLCYIGQIDLHQIDYRNRSAALGIVIGKKEHLGKGYGTEAVELLQKFVFRTLGLNRLELDLFEYNERAYRCYLKCGFKEEGRMRKKIFRKGQFWDVIKMSILRDEFES